MTMTWTDWQAIIVPLVLALGAVAVLMIDSFWGAGSSRWRHLSLSLVSSGAILFGLAFVVTQQNEFRPGFCRPAVEGPAECSLIFEPLTAGLWAVLLIGGLGVVWLSAYQLLDRDIPVGEYHFLLLSALVGATVLAGARDLATMVIALEVVSLPSFAMVALRRDRRGSEGALKAFFVSVLSTAVMLFGISYLYGVTGTLYLQTLAARVPGLDPSLRRVAFVAVLFVVVGFAFKIAAVPFHGWLPDTYAGAPVEVAAFLAVVSKSAGVAGLLVLVIYGIAPSGVDLRLALAILAAVTMTVGNVAALRQRYAVRLLAWSSIGQVGFLLAPLAVGDAQAVVAYLAAYVVVTLGAFGAVAVVQRHRPAGLLTDYQGMLRSEPGLAAALVFFLVVLAGLPPGLAGLFTKLAAFQSVIDANLLWLAIVMAVNVMIGLAVYLRWVAELFRSPSETPFSVNIENSAVTVITACTAVAVVFSVLPATLFALLN
ncbi:NADH-quinone oxidoreductase subunit N [Kribbella sp. DT2]|uniref:NADH-quinone oxidoreductase subunit N n=1 Tax=Kribbella sp. DT2 TaxID=3393427 RepID=UPI003CEA942B